MKKLVGDKQPEPIDDSVLDGRKYIVYDPDLAIANGDGWVVAKYNQGFWVTVTIEPFLVEPTHYVELYDDVI